MEESYNNGNQELAFQLIFDQGHAIVFFVLITIVMLANITVKLHSTPELVAKAGALHDRF